MNKAIKVLLINLGVVLGISVLMSLVFRSPGLSDFLLGFWLVSFAAACLDLFISLILFLTGKANYEIAKGFLLSSVVLFITGFAASNFTTIRLF